MNWKAILAIILIALAYELNKPLGIGLTILALLAMAKTYVQKYGISY
jgi:hypothetical protein